MTIRTAIKLLLGALVLSAVAPTAALADWRYYELTNGAGVGVNQEDASGHFQIDLGCDSFYFEKDLAIFISEESLVLAQEAVPMTVTVDGTTLEPIATELDFNDDGSVSLSAVEGDDNGVAEVIAAVTKATDSVRVEFQDKVVTFDMLGMNAAKDQLAAYCD